MLVPAAMAGGLADQCYMLLPGQMQPGMRPDPFPLLLEYGEIERQAYGLTSAHQQQFVAFVMWAGKRMKILLPQQVQKKSTQQKKTKDLEGKWIPA